MVDSFLAQTVHLVFAALWTGSVWYLAFVVLPLARDGAFTATAPLETMTARVRTVSRVSAVVLLVTGGHLAGTRYTAESLVGTINGQLVLAMLGFWLVLTALIEIGSKRLLTGLNTKKLREPAAQTLVVFRLAALIAIGLLVVAAAITTNVAATIGAF